MDQLRLSCAADHYIAGVRTSQSVKPGGRHSKSQSGQLVVVPVAEYSRFVAAIKCDRNCRVWEDDICSCGTERIRVEASKFLPS